ncbi:MAG: MASE1 domain-containing protein [Cyclobacteriaceae bacterium]|nr:MASE1 domain-containing protein [Cyclobacteriaceae bacterium]
MKNSQLNDSKIPWWTWIAPFVLFHAAGHISLLFKYSQGVSTFYIPTAIAVVMINWWGFARVIPAMFIVATLNTYYWGIADWRLWPLFSASEVIGVMISYLLFRKIVKANYWIPSTRDLLLFTLFGILIPIMVELVLLQFTLIYFGEQSLNTFGENFLHNWLGEFTANFGIATPLLYSITPVFQRKGWLLQPPETMLPIKQSKTIYRHIEITLIYLSLIILSLTIPFEKYWFAYGLVSLYIAIRFGFGDALFCNFYVFLITYVIPVLYPTGWNLAPEAGSQIYYIFLGNLLLSLFVAITGRVITDLRQVEENLSKQKKELEITNQELDRFVYSASHDLSAPLKSILGLVSISKMDTSPESGYQYLNEIEKSVLKLDSFIAEILDYSKNKRISISTEQLELKVLCQDIIENLKYMDNFSKIQIDLNEIDQKTIQQDKTRMKIILSNLISNAIRFQKRIPDHQSIIKISSIKKLNYTFINVEDNGEGIRSELSPKIFEMFYRASDNSQGSGLGLYIAKETAEKIGAKISLKTEYGKGTTFTLEVPELIS